MTDFGAQLRSAGMSDAESAVKSVSLEKLARQLRELRGGQSEQARAYFVPGRLEILGKHTDYAGGRSIVCAIERGISMVAAPREDGQVHLFDAGRESEARFDLRSKTEPALENWSNYAVTTARRLAHDFPFARTGADVVFSSDLPRASGMSSSSALIIAVFFALAEVNDVWRSEAYRRNIGSREELAEYLAAIESGGDFASFSGSRGVGTLGGSEDHVAILCSRAEFLRQYTYGPTRLEREIPMPEKHVFVIGVSGVKADKTGNARDAYNRSSLAARKILEAWNRATGRNDSSLAGALTSDRDADQQLQNVLRDSTDSEFPPELLKKRLAQFVEESNEIVPAAAAAFAGGNLERAGELVDRSQALAETLLGNQTPETMELARSARALGASAASAFGAGFGGSVWALLAAARAETFRERWASEYRKRYPSRAEASQFLITGAGPGMLRFA